MFPTIRQKSQTSAELHRSNAGHQMEHWARLKSNETCLCCLRRKPEHVYTCGHALCDVCVEIYGNAVLSQEYCYELPTCIHCGAGRLIAKIKPPTAGVRILSIDGGGVRGVVPLGVNTKEGRNKISFDEVGGGLFAFSQEVSIIDIRFE